MPATHGLSTPTLSPRPMAARRRLDRLPRRRRRHAGRLPIPGAELGLTYEDMRSLTPCPPVASSGRRYRLPARVDPGGLRLQGHRGGVRPPDRTPSRCRRVGRLNRRSAAGMGDHRRPETTTSKRRNRCARSVPGRRRARGGRRGRDVFRRRLARQRRSRRRRRGRRGHRAGLRQGRRFTATNIPHIFAAGDVNGNSMVLSARRKALSPRRTR